MHREFWIQRLFLQIEAIPASEIAIGGSGLDEDLDRAVLGH
jgi:hypothetical protein